MNELELLKQENEKMLKLVFDLYQICESEYPEDQWDENYKPVREAQLFLKEKGKPL